MPVYRAGQDQDERAMGHRKEPLRAAIKDGSRAALTRRGGPRVPEGGEKHRQGVDSHLQPPARTDAQRGDWTLAWSWLATRNDIGRKLVQKCSRFLLDIATYRWAARYLSKTSLALSRVNVSSRQSSPLGEKVWGRTTPCVLGSAGV